MLSTFSSNFLIFAASFLLFLPNIFGQNIDFWKIRQSLQNSRKYDTFEISPFLQPLLTLKSNNFYLKFSKNFALGPDFNVDITSECQEDLLLIGGTFINPNTTSPDLAAVLSQMMDATAKESPPPGFQRGAHTFYGFKQECDIIKYSVPNRQREFKTAYSRANIDPTLECSPYGGGIGFDICMPNSCSSNDLMNIVQLVPLFMPDLTNYTDFVCSFSTFEDINMPMITGSWIMVSFFSILAILVILAGFTDYFLLSTENPLREQLSVQLFLSFSVYTNVCEIMKATKSKRGQIGPINCLRVMSMFWVILGHSTALTAGFSNNILDVLPLNDYFLFQIFENAFLSVDTFFFIGGVLLSFMWFKNYKKDKKILMSPQGWIMFYVHRIIRLSAPYFVTLLAFTYLYGPIMQDSLLSFTQKPILEDACKTYMWKNLLYLINIDVNHMCMGHTWYLATDMQMFIATPIILIPLAIKPIFGWIIAIILLILSTAANFITVKINDFPPTYDVFSTMSPDKMLNYYKLIYYAMWIRCQGYIIGLLVGWSLQKYQRMRLNALINFILWLICAALMLTIQFGLYHYNQKHYLPIFWRAAYSSLSKIAWALGLAWIVISSYYGYGGPINSFMSWNIWVPLGRLSYCAYLVHYPLITYVLGLEKNAIYYSSLWQLLLNYYIPIVTLSFGLALVLSVLVEVPVGKLEMLLLRRPTTSNENNHANNNNKTSWDIPTKNDQNGGLKSDTHL